MTDELNECIMHDNGYEISTMLSGTYPRDLNAEIQLDLIAIERILENIKKKLQLEKK